MIAPGTILCFKTTGELAIVIKEKEEDMVAVRRPVMSPEDGIHHAIDVVFSFELETEEEHLRRDARSMLLKIRIQDEMAEEMEGMKKDKTGKMSVN